MKKEKSSKFWTIFELILYFIATIGLSISFCANLFDILTGNVEEELRTTSVVLTIVTFLLIIFIGSKIPKKLKIIKKL